MFGGFKRALPQISIFHHPSSPQSTKGLNLLKAALSNPYPQGSKDAEPLSFDLDVVEAPPTSDQLRTIISYLPSPSSSSSTISASAFVSSHPSSSSLSSNTTVDGVVSEAMKNPNVFKWPVVVNWDTGSAAVGDLKGVSKILEEVRKVRDGVDKGDEGHKPKGWFS